MELNWKTTNTPPNDPMDAMWDMLKSLEPTPCCFGEFKLIYLYKGVQSPSKRIINKATHVVPLYIYEEYTEHIII
jgi:hypothetical protein